MFATFVQTPTLLPEARNTQVELPLAARATLSKQTHLIRLRTNAKSPSTTFANFNAIKPEVHAESLDLLTASCAALPSGTKRHLGRCVLNIQEPAIIVKARRLRGEGLSYEKIATVMNTMNIKTKSGKARWYVKTERDLIVKE